MADSKITALTELTSVDAADLIAIVDDPSGTPVTKKITKGNLVTNIATSDITSGTFANARIAETNVTQHEAALTITESQISDLGSYQPLATVLTNTTASFTTAQETKLAGIETGATADQTAGEIKTAYESNANTNAFTDAEKTKLAGIEAGADVTDTTNVRAAGAPIVSSGAGIPSSTPTAVGDIYIDTTNDDAYIAVGTASSADWEKSNDGSGGGGAPTGADYVTLSNSGSLTHERVLTAGTGISITDAGAGSTVTVDSTITQYTDELAQDAVGGILVDSSEIDFTYNDATPSITASLIAGSIDETKLDTSVNASLDLADSSVQPGDNVSDLTNDAGYINSAGAPVQTVNSQTGTVVLDADDIDDTATTNKFVTAADITKLGNLSGTNSGDVTVLDSSEIDFTLTGQQITASIIAGSIDETKLNASTNASLDLADSAVQKNVVNNYTKTQYFGTTTLTDGATINWDTDSNQVCKVTLGGNRTMAAPTNMKDGATYILRIIQDGTGSRTITWNGVFKWSSGTAPTLSTAAGAIDIITFTSDGTNMYGVAQLNFS